MRLFCQTQTKTKTSGINLPVRYSLLLRRNHGGRGGDVGSGLVLGLSPENCRGSDLRTKAEFRRLSWRLILLCNIESRKLSALLISLSKQGNSRSSRMALSRFAPAIQSYWLPP